MEQTRNAKQEGIFAPVNKKYYTKDKNKKILLET